MKETVSDAFRDVPLKDAYKLVTPGMPILVATKGTSPAGDAARCASYDLAPIAWVTPLDYEPVTKVLFVCDPAHQTAANARASREFAFCVPASADDPLVNQCGSVSGVDADKYARFSIEAIPANATDLRIPATCAAWIECRLIRIVEEGSVVIFMGEAVSARKRI
jgi:flavin reductase (DIM6/NTAB) family NADH-FMN oxidoreductase RutF